MERYDWDICWRDDDCNIACGMNHPKYPNSPVNLSVNIPVTEK